MTETHDAKHTQKDQWKGIYLHNHKSSATSSVVLKGLCELLHSDLWFHSFNDSVPIWFSHNLLSLYAKFANSSCLYSLCWHHTPSRLLFHNSVRTAARQITTADTSALVSIITVTINDLWQLQYQHFSWLCIIHSAAQLSVWKNVGLTVELNQTNWFSGVNWIEIIFGELQCNTAWYIWSLLSSQLLLQKAGFSPCIHFYTSVRWVVLTTNGKHVKHRHHHHHHHQLHWLSNSQPASTTISSLLLDHDSHKPRQADMTPK